MKNTTINLVRFLAAYVSMSFLFSCGMELNKAKISLSKRTAPEPTSDESTAPLSALSGMIMFPESGSYEAVLLQSISSIEAADIDGDNHLDLIALNAETHTIEIYKGATNNQLLLDRSYTYDSLVTPVSMDDYDGDGSIDFATSEPSANLVHIQLNNGVGNLDNIVSLSSSPDQYHNIIRSADINSDYSPDLILASSNEITIYLNNGAGSFQESQVLSLNSPIDHVLLADINGDGLEDIIGVDSDLTMSELVIFYRQSDNSFQASVNFSIPGNASNITVSDIDNDGLKDIFYTSNIATTEEYRHYFIYNEGNIFLSPISYIDHEQFIFNAALGDLDQDGDLDLVVSSFDSLSSLGNTSILINDDQRQFSLESTLETPGIVTQIKLVDLDNDTDLDIVQNERYLANQITIWQNQKAELGY